MDKKTKTAPKMDANPLFSTIFTIMKDTEKDMFQIDTSATKASESAEFTGASSP